MKRGFSLPAALAVLLLILSAAPVWAGSINAVLNGKSYHFDSSYDWNENNTGLGLEYEFAQQSPWKKVLMANGFRDSNNNMSYMAGAGLHRRLYETDKLAGFYIYAGINAFVMTREDANGGDPFPGVLPSLSIGNSKMGFNLTYLPKQAVEETTNATVADPTLSGILFLQFKVSLEQLLP
jgi:hypothetical protein